MTDRALLSLATGALFVAVLALALGIVATVRADEGRPVGLVGQSGEMSGMEHGAAAPQEGVPNATARRGGRPLCTRSTATPGSSSSSHGP